MKGIEREFALLLTLNMSEQYVLDLRSMTDDDLELEYYLVVDFELPRHRYLVEKELLRRGIEL